MKKQRHSRATSLRRFCLAGVVLLAPCLLAIAADNQTDAHAKLLAGEPVVFLPDKSTAQRTVQAAWIEEAVSKSLPVHITYAVIQGPLQLSGSAIQGFELSRCSVEGAADFSQTTFKRTLALTWTEFKAKVTFHDATFENNADLTSAQFSDSANFVGVHAHGTFMAQRTKFSRPQSLYWAGGPTSFEHAAFDKPVSFLDAQFTIDANFDNVQMAAEGDFNGVIFQGTTSFVAATFAGGTRFSSFVVETRQGPRFFRGLRREKMAPAGPQRSRAPRPTGRMVALESECR